tara:strand:+ start:344 stop:604 length:261 start_codon:yes stop_codon:yes gene_type:complete
MAVSHTIGSIQNRLIREQLKSPDLSIESMEDIDSYTAKTTRPTKSQKGVMPNGIMAQKNKVALEGAPPDTLTAYVAAVKDAFKNTG